MAKLHAFAVNVVLEGVVTRATENFGAGVTQCVFVSGRQALRVDVAVPDHIAHAHPRLRHLAADQVQVGNGLGMEVDVGLIQPNLLLVEVVVQVLVGGARIIAATCRNTNTGVNLWVDHTVRAQTRTNTLTILVFAATAGFTVDLDVFVANAHVTLELGFGGPCNFLFESAQVGFFDLIGRGFLLGLLLAVQFGL